MKSELYIYPQDTDVILLPGKIEGPLGSRNIRWVFDPGAYRTIIKTQLVDSLGYGVTKNSQKISSTSIAGKEIGYTLTIQKLLVLKFEFKDIQLAAFDLPEQYDVDGLLGLDLLEKFSVTLTHRERKIQFKLL